MGLIRIAGRTNANPGMSRSAGVARAMEVFFDLPESATTYHHGNFANSAVFQIVLRFDAIFHDWMGLIRIAGRTNANHGNLPPSRWFIAELDCLSAAHHFNMQKYPSFLLRVAEKRTDEIGILLIPPECHTLASPYIDAQAACH